MQSTFVQIERDRTIDKAFRARKRRKGVARRFVGVFAVCGRFLRTDGKSQRVKTQSVQMNADTFRGVSTLPGESLTLQAR
jgi:hypothetical protein